jgi:DNA-directed RNA polymerase subunit RPC12/RpoP
LNEGKEHNDWELPFHSPDHKEEWYIYKCPNCGMEDHVPDFVVDEFAMGQKLKKGEMPGVACPRCHTKMFFKLSYFKYPYRNTNKDNEL